MDERNVTAGYVLLIQLEKRDKIYLYIIIYIIIYIYIDMKLIIYVSN